MKYYLAAPSRLRNSASSLESSLKKAKVTEPWWINYGKENFREQSSRNILGVRSADVLFAITSGQFSSGMMFEIGMALGLGKPVHVVTNCGILYNLPCYFFLNTLGINVKMVEPLIFSPGDPTDSFPVEKAVEIFQSIIEEERQEHPENWEICESCNTACHGECDK